MNGGGAASSSASIFLNVKSMHTVCMTTHELPVISEQRRLPSPAITPQALPWDSNTKLPWLGARVLLRIYTFDQKKSAVVDERDAPGIPWAGVGTNGTLRFTIGEGPDDDRYIRRFVRNA